MHDVLCASLRGSRGAVAILGAFVGTGVAMEMVAKQRSIVQLVANERDNELSTCAFCEEYLPVTQGLRRLLSLNLVEKVPITLGDLRWRLTQDLAVWQALL